MRASRAHLLPWFVLGVLIAAAAVTGVVASSSGESPNVQDFDGFTDDDRRAWQEQQSAAELVRLSGPAIPGDLRALPRAPRSLQFDLVDLGTLDRVLGDDGFAADLAVRGKVGGIAGFVGGIAVVALEPTEWIAARPGVNIPAGGFEISSTITLTPGPAIALATLDGYEPILPGDDVVVLLRRAQEALTPADAGVWWPVAYRGTWHVKGDRATASIGVPWLDKEGESLDSSYADLIEWERRNTDVPVGDLIRQLEAAARRAGWVTGDDLPRP